MWKKVLVVFFAMVLSVCMGQAAYGYAVLFDADAGGTHYPKEQIWGWDLEASIGEQTLNGVPVDFITVQDLGADNILGAGDTFSEEFTIRLVSGFDDSGNAADYYPYGGVPSLLVPANLYLDVAFTGYITNYSDGGTPTVASDPSTILDDTYTSIFYTGSVATLYVDGNANKDYDAGEIVVARFRLDSASPVTLGPSVYGGGSGAIISFGFTVTEVNSAYFAQAPGYEDPQVLIGQQWWLTFAQGGINYASGALLGVNASEPNRILIGFTETGIDAKFVAIPEPASMILLGSGLLGLAGMARRRKKN